MFKIFYLYEKFYFNILNNDNFLSNFPLLCYQFPDHIYFSHWNRYGIRILQSNLHLIKVVLVKLNEPFQIVENAQKNRKSENAISFFNDERFFGADAIRKKFVNPKETFTKLHEFLGKSYSEKRVRNLNDNHFISYDIFEDKVIYY